MKRAFALLLLAVLLLTLGGCEGALVSSGYTMMSVSTQTGESFRMSYMKFDGMKQYRLRTKQDNTIVRVDVESISGTLSIKVTSAGNRDELVFYKENIESGSFTFTVPEKGSYTVAMTADEHEGSYALDWSN